MRLGVLGRTPRDERDAHDQEADSDQHRAVDAFTEIPNADEEEQREAGGQRRLHDSEGRVRERGELRDDPNSLQGNAEQPERAP